MVFLVITVIYWLQELVCCSFSHNFCRVVSGQQDSIESPMQEVADILVHENSALKLEVDLYRRKVAKLQRVSKSVIITIIL